MTTTISEMALFATRWVELSILSKATIIVALGLLAAALAVRSRASLRHLLLVATFGMLLAIPVVVLTTPGMAIEVSSPRAAEQGRIVNAPAPAAAPLATSSSAVSANQQLPSIRSAFPSWLTIARAVWLAGAAFVLVSLMVALWRLRQIRRAGLPWSEMRQTTQSLAAECEVRRPVEILLHEEIPGPMTFGVWRPAVILPVVARTWSEVQLRRALIHELEHVRRGDWLVQLVARTACAFYWFHPLVWAAWRRLCLESERACDDAVAQNSERADYAEQLVLLAQQMSRKQAHPALGMANRSDLSTRISALLDGSLRRGRVGTVPAAIALSGAAIIVLTIAPVRAVSRPYNPPQDTQAKVADSATHVSPLDQALYEAAEEGDLTSIEKLLTAGANVNCAIDGDGSPLIGAARNGRLAAVRLLLDRGADPNLAVEGDGNPLIMAASEGQLEVVALLIERGAAVDQAVPGDENALIQASGSGHLAVVKFLVAHGANVNTRIFVERHDTRTGEWRSPLSMARKNGHKTVVDFLLASGAQE